MLNKEIKVQNIEYAEADDGFSLKVTANDKEFFIVIKYDDFYNKNEISVQYEQDDFSEDEVKEITNKIINTLEESSNEKVKSLLS